jgi:hypothetical protein
VRSPSYKTPMSDRDRPFCDDQWRIVKGIENFDRSMGELSLMVIRLSMWSYPKVTRCMSYRKSTLEESSTVILDVFMEMSIYFEC